MNTDLFEPPTLITKTDLEFQRKIGDGAYASVWRVKLKSTNQLFALKTVQKCKVSKILPQFRREVSIMYELEHPHIVKLHTHFEDFKTFYLLMDLCEGGTLFHKLYKEKCFSEKVACEYFRQIVPAIEYLHNHEPPIIHRDIKPENILLSRKNRVKVTDFGWANYMSNTRYTTCGTLEYLPPEIIEEKAHDLSVDIWCLGVLLYEMLCGTTPFKAIGKEMLIFNITKGSVRFPKNVSMQAQDLIIKMLDRTQETRLSIQDVKRHEWIRGFAEEGVENLAGELRVAAKDGEGGEEGGVGRGREKKGGRERKLSQSEEKNEEKVTDVTNFTEVCSGTKESIRDDDSFCKNDNRDEIEILNERLHILQSRVSALQNDKNKLINSEKQLKKVLYDTELELTHLQNSDNTSGLLENLNNVRKVVFDKIQLCKKQSIYLEQLKNKHLEATKDLETRETQLKQLTDSMKSLNLGLSRIKTYKSLDISTLQIDLDVIQYQLEGKINRKSNPSESQYKDIMEIVADNAQGFKVLSKKQYDKKIKDCNEKSTENEQKITELTINYELRKGKIMQEFRKQKDFLIKLGKKNREELILNRIFTYESEKRNLEELLDRSSRVEVSEERLEVMRKKKDEMKGELERIYVRIKGIRKSRSRQREMIDVREMEIDDIQFEIDKIKSMSKLRIWRY